MDDGAPKSRKILLIAAGVLAVLLLLFILRTAGCSKSGADLSEAVKAGLQNAQGGLAGQPGVDGMVNKILTTQPNGSSLPRLGPEETRAAGTIAPGGAVDPGSEAAAGAGAAEGSGTGDPGELELIRMKDRAQGESRSYDTAAGGDGAGRYEKPVKYRAPDGDAVAASLESFIDQVRTGGSAALGGGEGGPRGDDSGAATGGGSLPILTFEGVDDDKKTPTMQTLETVNRQGMHSVTMSVEQGFEDGSRDKSGKSFDGNSATFGAIPVEEIDGAFGSKQIKAVTDDAPSEGRVPSLR